MNSELQSPSQNQAGFKSVHVLLVEDSSTDRLMIRQFFNSPGMQGCVLTETGTAAGAIELYQEIQPDCLLVDYHLEDRDGLSLVQDLPLDREGLTAEATVVLITRDDNRAIIIEAIRQGVSDFLNKDHITESALAQAIHRAVERRRSHQELHRQRKLLKQQNAELRANQRALLNIMEDLEREVAQRRLLEEPEQPEG